MTIDKYLVEGLKAYQEAVLLDPDLSPVELEHLQNTLDRSRKRITSSAPNLTTAELKTKAKLINDLRTHYTGSSSKLPDAQPRFLLWHLVSLAMVPDAQLLKLNGDPKEFSDVLSACIPFIRQCERKICSHTVAIWVAYQSSFVPVLRGQVVSLAPYPKRARIHNHERLEVPLKVLKSAVPVSTKLLVVVYLVPGFISLSL